MDDFDEMEDPGDLEGGGEMEFEERVEEVEPL
jgi:hypothetical protein